jgi:hypothetical protein
VDTDLAELIVACFSKNKKLQNSEAKALYNLILKTCDKKYVEDLRSGDVVLFKDLSLNGKVALIEYEFQKLLDSKIRILDWEAEFKNMISVLPVQQEVVIRWRYGRFEVAICEDVTMKTIATGGRKLGLLEAIRIFLQVTRKYKKPKSVVERHRGGHVKRRRS